MKGFTTSVLFIVCIFASNAYSQTSEDLAEFSARRQASLNLTTQDLVQAPNTGVYMVPPDNFSSNPATNGFIHLGSATTIQIIEVNNVNMSQITSSLDEAYFLEQGFKLIKSEEIHLNNGQKAIIFLTEFTVNGDSYHRLFFFTGSNSTIWINVNFPSIIKGLLYKPIIESLKTVTQ